MFTKIVMVVMCAVGVLALLIGTPGFMTARFAPQEQSGLLLMVFGAVNLGFGVAIAAIRRVERALSTPTIGG